MKRFLVFLIVALVCFGLYKGCRDGEPQERRVDRNYFDNALGLKFKEVYRWVASGGYKTMSASVTITFADPGEYLFEGWANSYRGVDKKVGTWKFRVLKVPHEEKIEFTGFVHRLEVTRVVGHYTAPLPALERDTVQFGYFGSSLR